MTSIFARTPRADLRPSFQYRDAAGEPIDIDIVLALADGQRDAPAVRPAVGVKADRANLIVDQIALRGEELEVDARWQRVHPGIGRNAERTRRHVELEYRLGTLRYRLAARETQAGGDLARRALELGGRY